MFIKKKKNLNNTGKNQNKVKLILSPNTRHVVSRIMAPKDVHILIPRTYEYVRSKENSRCS